MNAKNPKTAEDLAPASVIPSVRLMERALKTLMRHFAPAAVAMPAAPALQVQHEDPTQQPVPDDVPCCPFCGRADTLRVVTAAELLSEDGEDMLFYGLPPSFAVVCDAANGAGGCGAAGGFRRTRESALDAWRSRRHQEPTVEDINAQSWKGMDGGTAFWLVQRHSEDWSHARRLMEAWLAANAHERARDASGVEIPPTFAVTVGAQKWAELKRDGFSMQRVVFTDGHKIGTIDRHGVVQWGEAAARSLHLLASGRGAMASLAEILDRARCALEVRSGDPGLLADLERAAAAVPRLAAPADDEPSSGNWYRAEDIDRLVLELDRMLGGDARAPLLCDVVAGVRSMRLTPFALAALRERARQVDGEGYDHQHDDEHAMGELIGAALCYACATLFDASDDPLMGAPPAHWPWAAEYWKPKDWRRNLQRAVALLLAEAERRERSEKKGGAA